MDILIWIYLYDINKENVVDYTYFYQCFCAIHPQSARGGEKAKVPKVWVWGPDLVFEEVS